MAVILIHCLDLEWHPNTEPSYIWAYFWPSKSTIQIPIMRICPIAEWSVIQTTIWIMDKIVRYSDAIWIPDILSAVVIWIPGFIGQAARYSKVRNLNGSVILNVRYSDPHCIIKFYNFFGPIVISFFNCVKQSFKGIFQRIYRWWKIRVVSSGIFLFHFARFSSNGVYFNGLKLSVCDVIVSQKGSYTSLVSAR